MPETPDFDRLARHAIDSSAPDKNWEATDLPDDVWLGIEANIVEQLRLVWNARGAADLAKIDLEFADGTLTLKIARSRAAEFGSIESRSSVNPIGQSEKVPQMRKVLALVVVLSVSPVVRAQTPDPATAAILAKIAALEQELSVLKAQLQERAPAVSQPSPFAEASAEAAKIHHVWPASTNTYTNTDLKDARPVAPPPAYVPPAPGAEQIRQGDYSRAALKDEMYWKSRMQDVHTKLDADALQLVAIERRVNALSADFNNSKSVSQRVVLRGEREAAATEAARLRALVIADRRAITTAEEEARRANVPPGWLRP